MGKVQGQGTTGSDESSKAKRRAFFLWNRLRQMYGTRWLDQFGTEPNDLWIRAVDDLTDPQIKHALELLVKQGGEHPPTLPKFVELARRPESTVRSTYSAAPPIDVWQKVANQVFHHRLKLSLAGGKMMVPVDRSAEMVEALRSLKARYGREYGSNPTDLTAEAVQAFQRDVEGMMDRLADDA